MNVMGVRLRAVVERVRRESRGLVDLDLARLNLRVGVALSRLASEIADEAQLVARAERVASEILDEGAPQKGKKR